MNTRNKNNTRSHEKTNKDTLQTPERSQQHRKDQKNLSSSHSQKEAESLSRERNKSSNNKNLESRLKKLSLSIFIN